ncbi:alpha/beta hydrolase family protein [Streptomyces flaveolus]|jgi:pimeloyl-ACP methyl ester carboxylesterase|uniref:alpha/beta hydrolase family protein n=1 Tax=Streptomyces flaveolus TaxID=67297 RepID=UPI0016708206|nr:alpha/beta hydrolase [Streptomyces flaveolus]GGQ58147.1 hydrolase [Streptomyces flaveolus]
MSDLQLASSRRGTGAPLVVIRQLDREGWTPVIDLLAREREVVTVDLPGFGDSPPLPGTRPTVQALATEVARWFPTAGLTRPPVVGNSLGGAVALELARAGAVSSAAALSPIGLWNGPGAAYALGSLRIARTMATALGDHTARVTRSPIGRTLTFWQLVARPWHMRAETADGAMRDLAGSPGFAATRRAARTYRLSGFTPSVPVTVAWGTRDLLTPVHQANRAARLLPTARHVRLRGCGHSPMSDDPDRIARLLLSTSTG